MRIPQSPPFVVRDPARLPDADAMARAFVVLMDPSVDLKETPRHHWDDLRRRTPPAGLDHRTWWLALILRRAARKRDLPIQDPQGRTYWFENTDAIQEAASRLDREIAGRLGGEPAMLRPDDRDRFVLHSLREEAIQSSLLEGAATTRVAAEAMLTSGRAPRTDGERMVLNNYRAMQHIRAVRAEAPTPDGLLALHAIVTEGTWKGEDASGRLRRPDEEIAVRDDRGELLYAPPQAALLPERLRALAAFAAGEGPWLHPVVRAILSHLWLAVDHPFVDGNGRTARALFYWVLLREGYWLAEFLPISRELRAAPAQYARSFLLCQTDDLDATYFVEHQLDVLQRALANFTTFVAEKRAKQEEIPRALRVDGLNARQLALLGHARSRPGFAYTIQTHQGYHGVTYATARADLLGIVEKGWLEQHKQGKQFVFLATERLLHLAR